MTAARHKTSRRDFLRGKSAVNAASEMASAITDKPDSPNADETDRSYLLQVSRQAMACEFVVSFPTRSEGHGTDIAVKGLDLIDELEDQLTVYRDTSEISHINKRASQEWVVVESRLFQLLQKAQKLNRSTRGTFDITAGPLVRTWGFLRREGKMPTDADLTAALSIVGGELVALDSQKQAVRFAREGVEINLGGIGKGYALDRAAQLMQALELDNFVFHGGQSSVLARGNRACNEIGWRVGLAHPLRPGQRLAEFRLTSQALGTSGSGTLNFYHQGQRYGHILDPRSGQPAMNVLASTVIAPNAAEADALATALYVMGIEEALNYVRDRQHLGALLVSKSGTSGEVSLHCAGLDEVGHTDMQDDTTDIPIPIFALETTQPN